MVLEPLKTFAKGAFRACGLEVRRHRFVTYSWLRTYDIATILDIGANEGQFARQIHSVLPQAKLYAFEPLPDCYARLQKNLSDIDGTVCLNFALGNTDGPKAIHMNAFSPSSSMLPMNDLHKEAFPHTTQATSTEIRVRRLDDVANELDIRDNVLIKIDVQGFEDQVILGGPTTIARAAAVIVETSFEPLYKGQLLFDAIHTLLANMGFIYVGSEDPARHPADGRILQCDSVFVKKSHKRG